MVDSNFEWQTIGGSTFLRCRPLAEIADHLFTTRDMSFRGATAVDDESRMAGALSSAPGSIVFVKQVHGRAVHVVRGDTPSVGIEADAVLSIDPAYAVAVRVADCVPILLADRDRRVVAAVHAGWRGTSAGVASAAVGQMRAAGIEESHIMAAVGPSIGPCCYQIDARVRSSFQQEQGQRASRWFHPDGPDHWRLDLWQANVDQLVEAGVPAANISVARLCTAEHLDTCFSYRAEGAGTGRMVGAIRMRQ